MFAGVVPFVATADAHSFTRAAQRLGVTPSAVSKAISKLGSRARRAAAQSHAARSHTHARRRTVSSRVSGRPGELAKRARRGVRRATSTARRTAGFNAAVARRTRVHACAAQVAVALSGAIAASEPDRSLRRFGRREFRCSRPHRRASALGPRAPRPAERALGDRGSTTLSGAPRHSRASTSLVGAQLSAVHAAQGRATALELRRCARQRSAHRDLWQSGERSPWRFAAGRAGRARPLASPSLHRGQRPRRRAPGRSAYGARSPTPADEYIVSKWTCQNGELSGVRTARAGTTDTFLTGQLTNPKTALSDAPVAQRIERLLLDGTFSRHSCAAPARGSCPQRRRRSHRRRSTRRGCPLRAACPCGRPRSAV